MTYQVQQIRFALWKNLKEFNTQIEAEKYRISLDSEETTRILELDHVRIL